MDEQQIIKRVLAGDKQAYAHIINAYKNPLYATIVRMTGNAQIAQDLVQEAFIKIYEQLAKYDGKGPFKSWLYRVATNYCIDEFRKKSYQMKTEELQEGTLQEPVHPEVIYIKNEQSRQLEHLLSKLPEKERAILLMRYSNELSYEEIAQLLQTTVSDVRNKLHRVKKKLRRQVKEGGFDYELSKRG